MAGARERNERLFLAGGVVRDLLLGRAVRDVDLVVEGDAVALARRVAPRLGARVRPHERFGTATLELPDGRHLDVAATRRETYERPGALPQVRTGAPVEEDLARRDFTINAIALELGSRARVLDPFGGREDLRRGLVRALHERSFLDDPTRAFRAVRYAHRLGFRLAPATRRWMTAALAAGALDRISTDRLRRELALLLGEGDAAGAVAMMEALGLAAAIHPGLGRRPGAARRVRQAERLAARSAAAPTWLCYLLAWMGRASEEEAAALATRLGLTGADARRVGRWPKVAASFPEGIGERARSEWRRASNGLSADELVAAAAALAPAQGRALLRAVEGLPARLPVGGRDLVAAGVKPGPAIGRALERTRAALEDGRISAQEAIAYAISAAKEEGA